MSHAGHRCSRPQHHTGSPGSSRSGRARVARDRSSATNVYGKAYERRQLVRRARRIAGSRAAATDGERDTVAILRAVPATVRRQLGG